MNSRGQEAGPFELLIAVIMMSFVLIVGYQAIEIVQFNDCQQQNDKMLEEFRTTLEEITRSDIQNEIYLSFQPCAPKKDQLLTLKIEQDPTMCTKLCSTQKPSCILLRLSNSKFSKIKCVDIRPQTSFSEDPNTCIPPEDGYTPVDLRAQSDNHPSDTSPGGIPEGHWKFRNVTTNNPSSPIICAFKQCIGSNC